MPRAALRRLAAADIAALASALGELFVDAVEDNASIGYMAGLTRERAARYWSDVAHAPNGRAVVVAEDGDGVAGVVIVAPVGTEFQPHRAEILKLVVHRRARGQGVGAMLMRAAEDEARAMGRPMLTLMTRHGSEGEALYRKLGWTLVGVIPEDSLAPDGSLADGAIYCKRVARVSRGRFPVDA